MRRTSSILALAAAATLAAANVAPAQRAAAVIVRPAANALAPEAPALRPLAVYRFSFTTTRVPGLPTEVTVADSAGQLVGRFRLPGERIEREMLALVVGEEIVLQGETPSGVLTLQLRQDETNASGVLGRWRLEGREGELRGRFDR